MIDDLLIEPKACNYNIEKKKKEACLEISYISSMGSGGSNCTNQGDVKSI